MSKFLIILGLVILIVGYSKAQFASNSGDDGSDVGGEFENPNELDVFLKEDEINLSELANEMNMPQMNRTAKSTMIIIRNLPIIRQSTIIISYVILLI